MTKNKIKYRNPSLIKLEETFDSVKEDFENIRKNWNQLIRNYLSKSMGVSLSEGDARFQISIEIKASFDETFMQIIDNNFPELDFEEYSILTEYLSSMKKSKQYFEDKKALHNFSLVKTYVEYRLKDFDILDITNDIFDFLNPKNSDVFGCYFLEKGLIEIYIYPIVLFCQLHDLDLESFVVMVLTHELAHAYNHIGRDKDARYWDSFSKVDNCISEGLAQYYTDSFIKQYYYKQPKLIHTFYKTLEFQSESYKCFSNWDVSLEQVYRAFIEVRRKKIYKYSDFIDIIEEAKKSIL